MIIKCHENQRRAVVHSCQNKHDLGNRKNSVGLKPKAKLRKDAKAPSYNIWSSLVSDKYFIHIETINQFIDNLLMGFEGALASFLNSALGFSP
jgi:hypothetical protein